MVKSFSPGTEKTCGYLKRLKRPALGLVVIALALTITFYLRDTSVSFEPAYLAFSLNLVFVCFSSFIISVIAARSFARTGNWPVIWLGCGALAYGLTMLISGWMVGSAITANAAATMHNIGALSAGSLHFLGAFFALNRIPPREAGRGRLATILGLYGAAVAFIVYVMIVSAQELLPPLFIQGTGGTTIRQMVVGTAVVMFSIAGLVFLRQYRHSKSDLLYWYSLGLLLLSIGMAGILLQAAMGTALNWTGRGAQLLSGLYLLAAALVTVREARAKHVSAGEALASLLTQTEARLREVEKRFRMVFEHAKTGIVIQDVDGKIIESNPALERLLGFTKKELQSRALTGFTHPDDAQVEKSFIGELMAGSRDYYEIEERLIRKDGQPVWVRLTGCLVRADNGDLLFGMTLVDDISQRKEAEKLKDDFIGMVSHELRNPLTVVMGSLHIAVKESSLPPEVMR